MRRLLSLVAAALGAGSMATPAETGAGAPIEVAPGTVVVWSGEGVDRCGMDGREWDPIGDACWYPIDLLTPAGTLELGRWRSDRLEARRVRVADYPYQVQHIRLRDDSQVHLSAADLARVRRESARIGNLWSLRTPRRFELPLAAPLRELPAGGRFGARRFFNGEPRSPHSGADYAADTGTPVLAVADGVVALAGEFFFSGRSLFIDHGDGLVSMYFHLSELGVEQGREVRRGDRLGRVGQTGRATGPHLHFGVRWRGARVDPKLLLTPTGATEIR